MRCKNRLATFPKKQKIRNSLAINHIIKNGEKLISFPLSVYWILAYDTADFLSQAGISIPQKRIRLAAERNLLKRRISESYRKNKFILYESLKKKRIYNCFLSINQMK